MKPNLYRLTGLILLILIAYIFIQPVYLNSEKRWSLICKTCTLELGDQVIIQIGDSSITSLATYISQGEQEIAIKSQDILLNGQKVYSISNRKNQDYQKKLKANQSFIIKETKDHFLNDYGAIASQKIIGKLIL